MNAATNDQLRQLLLQRLAPDDVARLEDAILMEEGVAERLHEEETDLIDDYARGRLAPEDLAAVERLVLTTPERMMTLRVARGLAAQRPPRANEPAVRASRSRWKSNRALPLGALLAASLAAVVLIPWGVNFTRPGAPPAAPTAAGGPERALGPAAQPPAEVAAPALIITLLTDVNRGGSRPMVHIASGAAAIRLQVEVPGPPRNIAYSLRVDDAAGRRVFEGSDLGVRTAGPYRFVEVTVGANALGPGARTIALRAQGSADDAPPEYLWQFDSVRDGAAQEK